MSRCGVALEIVAESGMLGNRNAWLALASKLLAHLRFGALFAQQSGGDLTLKVGFWHPSGVQKPILWGRSSGGVAAAPLNREYKQPAGPMTLRNFGPFEAHEQRLQAGIPAGMQKLGKPEAAECGDSARSRRLPSM